MSEFVLETHHLRKAFGALIATDDVTLGIRKGETHALIGPNGAGKTTLVGQLTGELKPDAGRITFDGRDITDLPIARRAQLGLARSFQITSIFDSFTAHRLSTPLSCTKEPVSAVASTRSGAVISANPVMRERCSRTASA